MRIADVTGTDLFGGTAARPLPIIRVIVEPDPGPGPGSAGTPVTVQVTGPSVTTPEPVQLTAAGPGQQLEAEVAVQVAAPHVPGTPLQVTAVAQSPASRAEQPAAVTVGEPGWTMWMVSHFHYDPVWWSTQGQFTESRIFLPDPDGSVPDVRTAFELVGLHLDQARRDSDYKFVLAEIDYLKPHFDACPQDRADLLAFIEAGRVEIVGGSYNEPNTNLTSAESTIRNAVYGLAFQREVLGADPSAAWMLDAFGLDPSYPGLMAAAGLTESAWARGPFHQWGPLRTVGDNQRMQFPSEFEWLSPSGGGLLTAYMPNHYGAGWVTHTAGSLAEAEQAALEQFRQLAPVAATRNVLLPVGADHVIPSRWATAIHRDWNARYTWPRFVTATPSEFFAAVRADAAERDIWITPQTRDMNPVYTGKDVSYIDTKQAQRAAEHAVEDGERLATLAWLAGAQYPAASLDKAWRQLVYGAHHDAITGTEGDQVYLDLLAGWQEAWERGGDARCAAASFLAGQAATASVQASNASAQASTPAGGASAPQDGLQPLPAAQAIVVFNTLSLARAGMVTADVQFADPGARQAVVRGDDGQIIGSLATVTARHRDGSIAAVTLTFRAGQVPSLGYRTFLLTPQAQAGPELAAGGWERAGGSSGPAVIENDAFLAEADPARGGALTRILDKRCGTELLNGPGNEMVLQEEYPGHPRWGEGPWLLSPKGPGQGSASMPAQVRAERCPAGSRLVAEFSLGGLRVRQETLLWDGSDRVEFRTHADGSIGQDRLLRVRFPARVPGGLPVYQSALSVVGRPPGSAGTDVAEHEFTLDNPAHEWFGVGSTARVAVGSPPRRTAIGVAEVITPEPSGRTRQLITGLMTALARAGVTATCSIPQGPRYGSIDVDSNLPDVRITLGGPEQNSFTAQVLASAGPAAAGQLQDMLAGPGPARLWVRSARTLAEQFAPGADLRGTRDLPVLVAAGADLDSVITALIADLDDAEIEVPLSAGDGPERDDLAGHCVALLNRGTPGSLVSPDGTLTISLMRACSAWPSGVWIDGAKRVTPDGTSFAWQHWSHTFEYALAAGQGDWRTAGFAAAGLDFNRDLLACVTDLHDGPLPATASLAGAEPAGAVISALKPRGNPLAPAAQPVPRDGVTVRLRDITGAAGSTRASVRLQAGVSAAAVTSLLEETGGPALPVHDGAVAADLPPAGTLTMVVWPDPAAPAMRQASEPAAPEAAQPVFTRYWLHGKGPAPAGNLPVAVHLSPSRTTLDRPGASAVLRLTAACGPAPASGTITVRGGGLVLNPPGPLAYDLDARGHAGWDLTVSAAPGTPAGRRFVSAAITGADGQLFEDVVLVSVGEPAPPALDLPLEQLLPLYLADQERLAAEVSLEVLTPALSLRPGERGEIRVALDNATGSQLRGEAQLISPSVSWPAAQASVQGFAADPGSRAVLAFTVTAPAGAQPGASWWALVKAMYFGRACYTDPVAIEIAAGQPGS